MGYEKIPFWHQIGFVKMVISEYYEFCKTDFKVKPPFFNGEKAILDFILPTKVDSDITNV